MFILSYPVHDLTEGPGFFAISFVLGVLLHLGYFIHGEHHMLALRYFQALLALPAVATLALVRHGMQPVAALGLTAALTITLLLGLFTSMAVYRGFFHRLRSFPGPSLAKYSKLWHFGLVTRSVRNFEEMDKLHREYGPFVRIGPNELSIVHPDAMKVVHGSASKCSKGTWYDSTPALTSMHSTRSRYFHDLRRRSWAKGFTAQALRDYEPRVKLFTQSLTQQIAARTGQPLNASQWFNYYSFDVMGDLAYGKSFDMLETGGSHWAIDLLNEGIYYMGTLGHVTWAVILFTYVPILNRKFRQFLAFCEKMIDDRVATGSESQDISSWIINSPSMASSGFTDKAWLLGDSRLIIVAGSDTTAATLTHLFYHLAKEPAHIDALREELDLLKGEFNFTSLQKLPFLNALINETLRLHPPVASGTQRITSPEGIQLGDTYIPGGVNIIIPFYTMFRGSMIPSIRTILRRSPHSQALLKELFSSEFDVTFAPGEDGTNLLTNTKDCFTMQLAPLNLCFTPRRSKAS
ncbi:Tryprostatin B 6-hydroxylase [Fonsecaea pedrosoi]|nr:Tryprostatin B 6-hydroxylase [Fonsecaea pedrosoi]